MVSYVQLAKQDRDVRSIEMDPQHHDKRLGIGLMTPIEHILY